MSSSHELTGTFHVQEWGEAEARALMAVSDYFRVRGRPVDLSLWVEELRTIGGSVFGYEVSYTATLREGRP